MLLGKHYWRVVVFEHEHYGRCTQYQFVLNAPQPDRWRDGEDWPGYERNHNNEHGGLPASLSRLYAAHRAEIERRLRPAS